MSNRSPWVPLGLVLASAIYLWNLLEIRARVGTTYNDFFAIPVTLLVLVGSSIEVIRALRRAEKAKKSTTPWTRRVRRRLDDPKIRMALLLIVFFIGFGRIPFVLWSTAFLVAAVAFVDSREPAAEARSVARLAAFYSVVTLAALVVSAALYVGFTQLGARL